MMSNIHRQAIRLENSPHHPFPSKFVVAEMESKPLGKSEVHMYKEAMKLPFPA
jgi:hypothetical protein